MGRRSKLKVSDRMVDTPEDLDRLADGLKAELARPETLRRLFDLVAPRLALDGRNLVYILAQVERIGHLAMELLFLNTLYGADYDRIVVVTSSTNQEGVNPAVLEITDPVFAHVETDDPLLPLLGFIDGGLLDMNVLHLLLVQPQWLTRDFGRAVTRGKAIAHFSLPAGLEERGDAWMRTIDVDPEDPFVLLHVRDVGYLPEKAHHHFRCASIERYAGAIDRLVEHGYRVFRLGDASSPPLHHPSGRVIDVPRAPGYAHYLDVYLSARCRFAVNQASGPEALVRGFGRPALTVNLMLEHLRLPLAGDLLMFKHIRRASDGIELSYREMLDLGLAGFGSSEQFEAAGLVVDENTAAELETAVGEMIAQVEGSTSPGTSTGIASQEAFLAIGRDYEARIIRDEEIVAKTEDFYAYAHRFGRVSGAFLEINPRFLG
jgi:putative glycosyltransferase (TIGR04372 family)